MNTDRQDKSFARFTGASRAQGLLKKEFNASMAIAPEGSFIKRPESLGKATKLKRSLLTRLKEISEAEENEIKRRRDLFQSLVPSEDALDYAYKSVYLEQRLIDSGATFGGKALNFCVDKVSFPASDIKAIEETALAGFNNLIACRPAESPSFKPTEEFVNGLKKKPNAARVDIILSNSGPKIIEANLQWVDGIQSLEGLRDTFLGTNKVLPTELLASQFRRQDKLAIVYLNSATGSRSSGELDSLRLMAERLVRKNLFTYAEVVDPEVVRTSYLGKFGSIYLNGDPRMIESPGVADWAESIFKSSTTRVFPSWRPELDKKEVLVEASERWPQLFAKTYRFSDRNALIKDINSTPIAIKGDSFSLRQVAISGTPLFESIWADAEMFPGDYVLQEVVQSIPFSPVVAFDTSKEVPVVLPNPYSKFNVWIIGGKVAGTMLSISDSQMISDKDFNTVPIP